MKPVPPLPSPSTSSRSLPRGTAPTIAPLTPHLFRPDTHRPLRGKRHHLNADTQVIPHHHDWGQVVLSTTGVVRLTAWSPPSAKSPRSAPQGGTPAASERPSAGRRDRGTYIVPPSRALWVPPGVEHAVTVVEDTELLTLYLHQPRGRCGPGVAREHDVPWRQCRVLEVSPLLRALALELDMRPDGREPVPLDRDALQRERRLSALILDELRRARPVPLGVDMPADKRLRTLCEAVLVDPTRHATLDGWARDSGASPRTVARLFRSELGTSFVQWRHQVLLARAVALAARKRPMATIAAELGYASPSAFSAMVRRSVGAPPRLFFGS